MRRCSTTNEVLRPFLRRVKIRNYKSIATCDVTLGPLTVLVGRNGAGKSNFLEAISLIPEALRSHSLGDALKGRGVIRRAISSGHEARVEVLLEFGEKYNHRLARYHLELEANPRGLLIIARERLGLSAETNGEPKAFFERCGGEITASSIGTPPPVSPDRPYLANAAGWFDFQGVLDALLAVGFYRFNPEAMRHPQRDEGHGFLASDGRNLASVLDRLGKSRPEVKERIERFLRAIVPGFRSCGAFFFPGRDPEQPVAGQGGEWAVPMFVLDIEGSTGGQSFEAASMSDGTLRALATLVASRQMISTALGEEPMQLIGIEEPETSLHPGATAALVEGLREATQHTQVLLTTHSADLLDHLDLERDQLLVVEGRRGVTSIAQADPASREAIAEHLYSAGELLRMDQLEPDAQDLERQAKSLVAADDR